MKAALNGGLNLSVRDGWWDEWYDGANGWEIPSADGVDDPDRRDELEASALYELLENSVSPLFYDQDAAGVPDGWVEMIRHTLRVLGPRTPAERMVREYVTTLYAPAAASVRTLADGGSFQSARDLARWKRRVELAWPSVRIDHVEADAGEPQLGTPLTIRAAVALGDLTPEDVCVEVVSGLANEHDELVDPSFLALSPDPATGQDGDATVRYSGAIELGQPGPFGYTVRVLPRHALLASRAELGLVTVPEGPSGLTGGDLR
jgi:starch phosphorylase